MNKNAEEPGIDRAHAGRATSLRIAYLAPTALLDSASGAAQSLSTMLAALVRSGQQCFSLSATCFDSPHGEGLMDHLASHGLQPRGRVPGGGMVVWQGQKQGVRHSMMYVHSQKRMEMTAREEMHFRDLAEDWLARVQPDVVIVCGGLPLDLELQRMARRAGAIIAFYLANPRYRRISSFESVDLVLANSGGTANLYQRRLGLASVNIGLFVDPQPLLVAPRSRDFVSFVNPMPEKGVTLFLKLVQRARSDCPTMRFLVVESRARIATALERMGLPQSTLKQVTLLPCQSDLREVYRQTRILLMPSFWFEAAGRLLIEATANGIPVIATNRGGIPETLAGGGVLLDIPEACTRDHWHVPSDDELAPWWNALMKLWQDPVALQRQEGLALESARRHSLEAKTQALLGLFRKTLTNKKSIS